MNNSAVASAAANTINFTTTASPAAATYLWSVGLRGVFAADVFLFVAAISLHLLGIFLIFKTKTPNLSTQNIFLIHLSLTSIFSVVLSFVAVYHKAYGRIFPRGYIFCYFVAYMSYILNLILIAIDRLLFILLPFKYGGIIIKPVVYVELLVSWVLAITYGLVMKYAGLINNAGYNKYASYVYNGFVVAFTSAAYLFIIFKVFLAGKSGKLKLRNFLVPFLIVATFFVFNIVPHAIATKVKVDGKYRRKFIIGLVGLNIANNVSDAIIYIFFVPKIYKKLVQYVGFVFYCCDKKKTCDETVHLDGIELGDQGKLSGDEADGMNLNLL